MSNSGNAYGSHLHFEVYKNNNRLNPYEYLDKDLTNSESSPRKDAYQIGDHVKINGVYISSTSTEKLVPAITEGIITRIIPNARNPYLLNNGRIGWVNDSTIISSEVKYPNRYLSNPNYHGFSIVDALKEINIDSSYQYRSKLASLNDIPNYTGTGIQNTIMLNLLKEGRLKY